LLDLTQVIVTVSLKTHKKSDFEGFEFTLIKWKRLLNVMPQVSAAIM
jgi:hypothetical protein